MYKFILVSLYLLLLVWGSPASAMNIFACEPEWASLSKELGGDLNTIKVAITVHQDPHHVQAKPSLIASIRKADLLICSGADLEIGWLPLLLRRSNNHQIQVGQAGYFEASTFIRRLEVPAQIDRSQGDVHPQGNPHIHLDPRNIRLIAKALTQRLISLDPGNSSEYQRLSDDFQARWKTAMRNWKQRAKPLKGLKVIDHHTSFSYLEKAFDLNRIATLEAKPGIPPSGAHLSSLLKVVADQSPKFILRTPYEDPGPAKWLTGRTGVKTLVLPYSVGEDTPVKNLFDLYDVTLSMLLAQPISRKI